jgi:hypothetical protein
MKIFLYFLSMKPVSLDHSNHYKIYITCVSHMNFVGMAAEIQRRMKKKELFNGAEKQSQYFRFYFNRKYFIFAAIKQLAQRIF